MDPSNIWAQTRVSPVAVPDPSLPSCWHPRLYEPRGCSAAPAAGTAHHTHATGQDTLGPTASPAVLLPLETHRCFHTLSQPSETPLPLPPRPRHRLAGWFSLMSASHHALAHPHSLWSHSDPRPRPAAALTLPYTQKTESLT